MSELAALLDQFAVTKKFKDKDQLAEKIIREFLIPQGRFAEAWLWVQEMITGPNDKAKILSAIPQQKSRQIWRLPNWDYLESLEWQSLPITERKEVELYGATLAQCEESKAFSADKSAMKYQPQLHISRAVTNISDVWEGEPDLPDERAISAIAYAIIDYVEFGLLKGKKKLSPSDADYAKSAAKEAKLQAEHDAYLKKLEEEAAATRARTKELQKQARDLAEGISKYAGSVIRAEGGEQLRNEVLAVFDVANSKKSFKVEQSIIFCQSKFYMNGRWHSRSAMSALSVGSQVHTEYSGISSSTTEYLVLTVQMKDYTSYNFWITLGRGQAEINQHFPPVMRKLEKMAQVYLVQQGDSWQSSGGYTTSYGVGFWG